VRARQLLAAAAIGLATPSLANDADPPCSATLALEPSAPVVGQQVLVRLRVRAASDATRVEWIGLGSVDGAWLAWLPDRADPATPGERELRRALFPMRSGEIRIPASRLRCVDPEADADRSRGVEVAVAGPSVRAHSLPSEGRPPGFGGTVGPVTLHAVAVPEEIELGQSVRLALMVRGEGDLRSLPDPLPELETAEVFRRAPELSVETGPRLSVVRHFAYDLVPERAGHLVLPKIRVPYFDPTRGSFATATAEPITLRVRERASPGDAPPADSRDPSIAGPASPPTEGSGTGWIAGAVAALAAAAAAGWGGRGLLRRRALRRIVVDLAAPASDGDAPAVARLLRAALEQVVLGARTLAPDEIAARPTLPERARDAVQVLARVERARFDPNAAMPPAEEILRAARRLYRR